MSPVHPDLTALVGRRLAELGFDGRRMSYRQAAKRAADHGAHLSPETIRRLHLGTHSGNIEDSTVDGLVAALGCPRAEILGAMHRQITAPLPAWQPPDAAQKLSLRQRRVIEAVIFALTDDRDSTGTESDQLQISGGSHMADDRLPAVSTERVQLTPDISAVLGRLGEAAGSSPELRDELATFSEDLFRRYRGEQTNG